MAFRGSESRTQEKTDSMQNPKYNLRYQNRSGNRRIAILRVIGENRRFLKETGGGPGLFRPQRIAGLFQTDSDPGQKTADDQFHSGRKHLIEVVHGRWAPDEHQNDVEHNTERYDDTDNHQWLKAA